MEDRKREWPTKQEIQKKLPYEAKNKRNCNENPSRAKDEAQSVCEDRCVCACVCVRVRTTSAKSNDDLYTSHNWTSRVREREVVEEREVEGGTRKYLSIHAISGL